MDDDQDDDRDEQAEQREPSGHGVDLADLIARLDQKLDTVAGATAAVASTQTNLLARMAEAEGHRSEDALDVAQRLDALERQVLALTQARDGGGPGSSDPAAQAPVAAAMAELTEAAARQHDDLALALEVLARMAEALERSDARTEDRLAAVRDAAAIPVADLQALLSARADRTDAQLAQLAASLGDAVEAVTAARPLEGGSTDSVSAESVSADAARLGAAADRITERLDELGESVRALSWRLPEITEELVGLREQIEGVDVGGPVSEAADDLGVRLTLHTDTALAGVLRLFDERLNALRSSISQVAPQPGGQSAMGFEAGAVMGAAQAAWNRLEQRLDAEFDDLGRQLQSMAAIIEQALATAEAAANRPVVTGDQLRRAATSVKETVFGAGRTRRDRRGGPRGLGPGGGSGS
jgi:hypothetical protein